VFKRKWSGEEIFHQLKKWEITGQSEVFFLQKERHRGITGELHVVHVISPYNRSRGLSDKLRT
jgi:hypothetical protein